MVETLTAVFVFRAPPLQKDVPHFIEELGKELAEVATAAPSAVTGGSSGDNGVGSIEANGAANGNGFLGADAPVSYGKTRTPLRKPSTVSLVA